MNTMIKLLINIQASLNKLTYLDFLATVPLRVYLAAVFWTAGYNKFVAFDSTTEWFGNPELGLGMPFPELMAFLAISAEMGGAALLLLGLATRWATIPLMVTMAVAAVSVHWHNGWQAVHDVMSPWASENAVAAIERLDRPKSLLQEHGNYNWLTEHGSLIASNNGIEWAATYFIMLMALFMLGGGRFFSVDFWINKTLIKKIL